jgi:transcriptional regulator with GAF, ATPase, and Fis domain
VKKKLLDLFRRARRGDAAESGALPMPQELDDEPGMRQTSRVVPVADIRERAEYHRVRARRKARAHYLAAKRNSRMHSMLGVPIVAISTVVGSTVFATLSKDPSTGWKIATGLLSLAAAVMAAIQTFFRHSELAEKHRSSAASYASLRRNFDVFQLRLAGEAADREQHLDALKTIIENLDQLERESPDIPDQFYDQAVREHVADKET